MLCPYELNGICNDENCAYLHVRDFAEQDEEREEGDGLSGPGRRTPSLSADGLAFLANFTATRRKYLTKWPVITPKTFAEMVRGYAFPFFGCDKVAIDSLTVLLSGTTPQVTVEDARAAEQTAKQPAPAADGSASDTPASESTPACASADGDGWTDYLALDAPDDMASDRAGAAASFRYYDDSDQQMADSDELEQLQRRVEEYPDDSDAWLRLAIRQLNLDITLRYVGGEVCSLASLVD